MNERVARTFFFFSPANAPHLATLLFDSADLRIDMPKVHDTSGNSLGAMCPSVTPRPDAQLVLDASLVSVVLVFVQVRDNSLVNST